MKHFNEKIRLIIILIFLINSKLVIGQVNIPQFETPKPATLTPNAIIETQTGTPNFIPNYNQINEMSRTESNNNAIMQEVEYYEKLQQQNNEIKNANNEFSNSSISYSLPSFSGDVGTENFRNAFDQINEMLQGKQPVDLKKAVFLSENAFLDNQLDYKQFDNRIKKDIQMTKLLMRQRKYNENKNLSKNLALFQYMSDTTKFYNYSEEGAAIHLPFSYDFNDFCAKDDWTKMFVSKLLVAGNGQCHSLPLLYLIYAQEIGTEAYLTLSPSHSYVKIKDADNVWYNLELTNGLITTDAAIMASGYIKTEAIKNQIYMDTISTKETVAACMLDLAKGYYHKFGYDDFMSQCADTVLKYFPNFLDAYQVKVDYYTVLLHHVGKQLPVVNSQAEVEIVLQKYSKAKEIRDKRNELYETIDNLGYTEMPAEEYQKWLKSVSKQANKQENKAKILYIQNKVK
jgi:hypothetical protein